MRLPARLSLRKKNSHKGDYGHILVLAGSRRYSGAALLCAESALRSGAGMVTLGLPESVHRALIGKKIKELISVPFPENKDGAFSAKAFSAVREFMKQADVLIIGPGMGSDNSTRALARKIVAAVQKPQVVDADALNALAGFTGILKNHRGEIILTPHEKEMSRLFDINIRLVKNNRKLVAKKCAKYYNSIIVLKGHCSVVTDGDKNFYLNHTGNPGMATAGSGDVLSGITGAFLAQGLSAFQSAKYATYIHGLAGDLAEDKKTQLGLIASDIIDMIPGALKKSM